MVSRDNPGDSAERAHGRSRGVAIDAVDAVFRQKAEPCQTLLDVLDGRTGVMSLNRIHASHGSAPGPCPPWTPTDQRNLLTNKSSIETSRSRESEGCTMSIRRFFAMLVRFSA